MKKLTNDIEKAIDALKMDNDLMEFDPNTGEERPIESQNELNQCVYKANLLAISALEKQIAKKPKKIKLRQGTQWLCPACGSTVAGLGVGIYKEFYCNECGQRQDWEVEE